MAKYTDYMGRNIRELGVDLFHMLRHNSKFTRELECRLPEMVYEANHSSRSVTPGFFRAKIRTLIEDYFRLNQQELPDRYRKVSHGEWRRMGSYAAGCFIKQRLKQTFAVKEKKKEPWEQWTVTPAWYSTPPPLKFTSYAPAFKITEQQRQIMATFAKERLINEYGLKVTVPPVMSVPQCMIDPVASVHDSIVYKINKPRKGKTMMMKFNKNELMEALQARRKEYEDAYNVAIQEAAQEAGKVLTESLDALKEGKIRTPKIILVPTGLEQQLQLYDNLINVLKVASGDEVDLDQFTVEQLLVSAERKLEGATKQQINIS